MSTSASPLTNWNDASGDWQGLRQERQAARYREIARLVELYAPNGKVLDVGCGEGVLMDYLNLEKISQYTGIDPSATAVSNVVLKRSQDNVERTTVEQYQAGQLSCDVIVLSEVLYYLQDPVGIIEKFAGALTKNGVLIISIFQRKDRLTAKSLARKLVNWLRQPNGMLGNRHCTRIVEAHLQRRGYIMRERFEVVRGADSPPWRFYVVQIPSSHNS
jgi:2-polyprenyl-3-methyl-5-hydroxy-6-metoxy-1,4-benzoquinol methylase